MSLIRLGGLTPIHATQVSIEVNNLTIHDDVVDFAINAHECSRMPTLVWRKCCATTGKITRGERVLTEGDIAFLMLDDGSETEDALAF